MIAATLTTRPAGNTNTGEDHQGTATRSAESLFRDARQWADDHGLNVSHSKLSRIVRGYRRAVTEQTDRGPVLTLDSYMRQTYADPVGEAVARNVDQGLTSLWATGRGGASA